MSDRAVILVDGGYYTNVNYYCEDEFGKKIDLHAMSEKLCDEFGFDLLRTKFYHARPYLDEDNPTDEQEKSRRQAQSFFDTIDNLPRCQFEEKGRVKLDHADCPKCNNHFRFKSQKGVDVGIAVDLVQMASDKNAPDAFIIISGDEDLKHAMRAAKDNHASVFLAHAYNRRHELYSAQSLRQEADQTFNIADGFLSDVTQ